MPNCWKSGLIAPIATHLLNPDELVTGWTTEPHTGPIKCQHKCQGIIASVVHEHCVHLQYQLMCQAVAVVCTFVFLMFPFYINLTCK